MQNTTEKQMPKSKIIEGVEKHLREKKKKPILGFPNHETILQNILSKIKKIDFFFEVYPHLKTDFEQRTILSTYLQENQISITDKENPKAKEFRELDKELSKCKVTDIQKVVKTVEYLLKFIKDFDFGLSTENGYIHLYNGAYWKEIGSEKLTYFLGEVAEHLGVEQLKSKYHKFKTDLIKQFFASAYLASPIPQKGLVYVNLQNGTFEITKEKQQLREFKREDFCTYQLPFAYETSAKAPIWDKFLSEVLPDKDAQNVLAEYLGYIFTKGIKQERCLLLYGGGANGKSVVFDVITALLGKENISHYTLESLTDKEGYSRAKIVNKLANYASEISSKMNTDKFKSLVSGEPTEARLPYKEPFEITDVAKFIFNTNLLPKDVEHNNAFYRRFIILPFDATILESEQDKELANKIIDTELSGVFNWILEGLQRLLKQGKFTDSELAKQTLANFKNASDTVALFMQDSGYTKSVGSIASIKATDLYKEYKAYCIDFGYNTLNQINFGSRMKNLDIPNKRTKNGFVYFLEKI